jgi:hypothetical protein
MCCLSRNCHAGRFYRLSRGAFFGQVRCLSHQNLNPMISIFNSPAPDIHTIPQKGMRENPVTQERRRTPRYSFSASAELIDEQNGVSLSTCVSELSLHGCYLDMVNHFPHGTSLLVKIFRGSEFFEARATVVYSRSHLGTGVTFHEVKPYFQVILKAWLLEVMRLERTPSG